MRRQEFVDKLKTALEGSLSRAMVEDYVNYYEDYIRSQVQQGNREEDVLAALGDPRLIARTIIQTNVTEENTGAGRGAGDREYYNNGGFQQTVRRDAGEDGRQVRIPGWVWILGVILIIIMILGIIMSVLSFLAPILIPVLVIMFLIKLFRDWLN